MTYKDLETLDLEELKIREQEILKEIDGTNDVTMEQEEELNHIYEILETKLNLK